MGCASGLVRTLLFIFNFAFVLTGVGLIAVGVIYLCDFNDFDDALDSLVVEAAPIMMTVLGSIIFLIAFFGCCGALKGNTCMLTTYAVVILTLFGLQIALGIYAFLYINDEDALRDTIDKDLKKHIGRYYDDKHKQSKEAMDLIQSGLKCCGAKDSLDWAFGKVPSSCCDKDSCNQANAYKDGCTDKAVSSIQDNIKVIGIVLLSLSATEIVVAVFALCLSSSIKNEQRRSGYA